MKKVFALLFAVCCLAVMLSACGKEKGPLYHVDYNGQKDFWTGAKDEYPAGERVKLFYNYTDTIKKYTIYRDGEPLTLQESNRKPSSYYKGKGFIYEFDMPDHDVSLKVEPYPKGK